MSTETFTDYDINKMADGWREKRDEGTFKWRSCTASSYMALYFLNNSFAEVAGACSSLLLSEQKCIIVRAGTSNMFTK